MKIGLIDVDGHNFPNLALMKLSAYHKSIGDDVEFYKDMLSDRKDIVYVSKVFSFTQDYNYYINAQKIIKGGTGYCIRLVDGVEVFDEQNDLKLPKHIEHIMPDYSLYKIHDTAYGYLTRGCPRNCSFCIVTQKEGLCSKKVADLTEFWNGQKKIKLLDPNITASKECLDLFEQLIDSKAEIDFTQGLDIRCMTEEMAYKLKQMKIKTIHFAFDNIKDKKKILEKLQMFKNIYGGSRSNITVYILGNFGTSIEQDLHRIYAIRDIGYSPFYMIYKKYTLKKGSEHIKLQRFVNNRIVFNSCKSFNEYRKKICTENQTK